MRARRRGAGRCRQRRLTEARVKGVGVRGVGFVVWWGVRGREGAGEGLGEIVSATASLNEWLRRCAIRAFRAEWVGGRSGLSGGTRWRR